MNTTLVLSSLIFIFAALAIAIEIGHITAASRSRRIVIRRTSDDDAGPWIAVALTSSGAGAFAGSPVSITGPGRDPILAPALVPARVAASAPIATGPTSRRAVYDFVPPAHRKPRVRNVHG